MQAKDFAKLLNVAVPYDMPGVVIGDGGGIKLVWMALAALLRIGLDEQVEPGDRGDVEEAIHYLEIGEGEPSELEALDMLNDLFTEDGYEWELSDDGELGLYERL